MPDDSPADALLSVKITTLRVSVHSATPIPVRSRAGDYRFTKVDIDAGKLTYTPVADANGAAYTNFTFQVRDDGGTANGGVDLDQSANTLTIDVTGSERRTGGRRQHSQYPGRHRLHVQLQPTSASPTPATARPMPCCRLRSRPSQGLGTLNHTDTGAVSAGDFVTKDDIDAGKLKYEPVADANGAGYTNFTFQVRDDGGTANGGVDLAIRLANT